MKTKYKLVIKLFSKTSVGLIHIGWIVNNHKSYNLHLLIKPKHWIFGIQRISFHNYDYYIFGLGPLLGIAW